MLINLFYILLFAIATVIIYIWGMKNEQSKEKELLDNLYKKSEKIVIKSFKQNKTLSRKDIENELTNVKSSLFYSKHKLVIKNPSHLAKIIIGNLLNNGTIIKTTNGYTLKYKSK